jgi:hypothetical protein
MFGMNYLRRPTFGWIGFLIQTDCVNIVNMLREVCVGLILCFASFCYTIWIYRTVSCLKRVVFPTWLFGKALPVIVSIVVWEFFKRWAMHPCIVMILSEGKALLDSVLV